MGKILLEGMEFYAHHGYYEEERERGNKFEVDLQIEVDISGAAHTDDITKTINYENVYEVVKTQMKIPSKLLEHVAQRIVDALKKDFPAIISMELKIAKLNPMFKGAVKRVSIVLSV